MSKYEKIARTGRVQSWIDNPQSRLPMSCTVFVVEDEMEGPEGIEASWRFVSHALRNGAGVAVHLSKLRPNGENNGKGLVASGPVSFGKIYSSLNEVLRRGGVYKNGAVVLHLDLCHPDALEFITASREELPWVKRCIDIQDDWWDWCPNDTKAALVKGIAGGDIWLNKVKYDKEGQRIYGNVCLEVYLRHRATCLLQHVNLGACLIDDIPKTFQTAMEDLCKLHATTGAGDSGEYLKPEEDRQVGLGMIGLANLLDYYDVTYSEFADALEEYIEGISYPIDDEGNEDFRIVAALDEGFYFANNVAKRYNMERAFAIAPTATCSYQYLDHNGYTTCPEIAPPTGRTVDRDSGTFGVQTYNYGTVETAEEVGWSTYQRVANGIVKLLSFTERFHGYSMNTWNDQVTYNEAFVEEWLAGPQTSMYYALPSAANSQDKSDAYAAIDLDSLVSESCGIDNKNFCASCAE